SLADLIDSSDIIFVSTPDSVIEKIDTLLYQEHKDRLENKILIHCSGALSSSEGFRLSGQVCKTASLHPMMAFNSKDTPLESMQKCFYTFECEDRCLNDIDSLMKHLNVACKRISPEDKASYHLASVLSSNCVVALFDMAQKLLGTCGFSEEESRLALSSLLIKNADNIVSYGVYNALTGPVIRNDTETIAKHLNILNRNDKELYALLGNRLLEISKTKCKDTDYDSMSALLNKEITDEGNRSNL
ncbi:MAG: Rossmann-like and DUF2520 domain-containing protein, partial [Succinivibrio sp.]